MVGCFTNKPNHPGLQVVLLTNDAENRRLAREAGLEAFTCMFALWVYWQRNDIRLAEPVHWEGGVGGGLV